VDALIERDVGTQRLYVQQDANWNVTAIVGKPVSTWIVQERYAYDPYGLPSFLNPTTWAQLTNSLFSWIYLHQGGRYDTSNGLYYFRNRDYSPTLGRWMQQDPIEYHAGDSDLYRYEGNSPVKFRDPSGLEQQPFPVVISVYDSLTGLYLGGIFISFSGDCDKCGDGGNNADSMVQVYGWGNLAGSLGGLNVGFGWTATANVIANTQECPNCKSNPKWQRCVFTVQVNIFLVQGMIWSGPKIARFKVYCPCHPPGKPGGPTNPQMQPPPSRPPSYPPGYYDGWGWGGMW
jgi:RHS repeat-associated protein